MDNNTDETDSKGWGAVWIILLLWVVLNMCEEPLTPIQREIEVDTYILRGN